ncbi:MAG: hypothetical protein J0I54_20680 [Bosea sp.]|uniref:hypothetical protein n=1 Tax=unclassified Bosea (in: a-proteobacteria) TaxID=2653178 RepID=UPI000969BE0A|nr:MULTISPECIES: hypothetical protein [unclassified Bosea (in: a-proteobacteria)]MBN9459056.1 hypothetical protein [Bosea sp. (in: a-proteobacteria)]OJV06205.1 MAG: hypothetical protein BGO20_08075 [Bosea sp. 67-29]
MSLTRIALRLAALAAIKASPALAGVAVFDSAWSHIDRTSDDPYVPVVIVSTEDVLVDENEVRFETNRRVDMLIQISLATLEGAFAEIAADDWDTAEVLLDILEQEIDWALERDPTWSGLVQHVDKNSTTVRDASGATKMPHRLLVLSARVFEIEQQAPAIAPNQPAQGLDRWGAVIASLAAARPAEDKVRQILENRAAITLAEQVQRLATVAMKFRPAMEPKPGDDETVETIDVTVELPAPPTP